MPHSKRQSSTDWKRSTERQIVLTRRSRSIKSSLLKALSLDLVALYHADQTKDSDATPTRNQSPHQYQSSSNLHNLTELREPNRFVVDSNVSRSVRPVEQPATQSNETDTSQVQNTSDLESRVIPRPTSRISLATIAVRCFAFLLGVLIRCALIFYLQPFAILLSGVAIAVSGISVLLVVMFTPWKKKLLWNLSCLFGGLLIAVLVL